MEIEKQLAWIKIGIIFTMVLWIVSGLLILISRSNPPVEIVGLFVISLFICYIFVQIYYEIWE